MTPNRPLQVAVFGATGKIGSQVIDQLLAAGHTVTAYARNLSKLPTTQPNLTVIQGGLDDPAGIGRAVAGADAVISALGPSLKRGATGTPVSAGTRTIVAAMHAARARRFIGLATPSIPDPRDQPTLKGKLLPVLARLALPNALTELRGMTDAITSSDLDWTIARITSPTTSPPREPSARDSSAATRSARP
jgi:nucleoside-diphosphate-sugar epimerase